MQADDELDVERLGGFAGFGGPGAHLRSVGRLLGRDLGAAERRQLGALFDGPAAAAPPPGVADGFRYRLTLRQAGQAAPRVVELPEAAVPACVRDCVHDELI